METNVVVNHSNEGTSENASRFVLNGTLRIGSHTYTLNWVVANCRYDVLLGMPLHVAHNPQIDFVKRNVTVGCDVIKLGLENIG